MSSSRHRTPLQMRPQSLRLRARAFMALALLAALVAPLALASPAKGLETLPWVPLVDGLKIAAWTPGPTCREDLSAVIVRIDPALFSFSVHHFRDEGLNAPLPLSEWQRYTNASLLFNAGLFLEDFSYMGLLYKNGRPLSPRPHSSWHGLFVAEPIELGMRQARIVDLARETFPDEPLSYREAAQALMVLDRSGRVRVRNSGKRAQQTLVADDAKGYVYLVKTVAAASLFGLAECLHTRLPWIRQVMAMDGGSSSDMLVGVPILQEAGKAAIGTAWRSIVDGTAPAIHIPLPTVIAVFPRIDPPPADDPSSTTAPTVDPPPAPRSAPTLVPPPAPDGRRTK